VIDSVGAGPLDPGDVVAGLSAVGEGDVLKTGADAGALGAGAVLAGGAWVGSSAAAQPKMTMDSTKAMKP